MEFSWTEGTPGAADRVSFREEAREAALPRSSAQAFVRGHTHEIQSSRVRGRTASLQASRASQGAASATGGVRAPNGLGQSLACEPSHCEGAQPAGESLLSNQEPLTREDSTLRSSCCPLTRDARGTAADRSSVNDGRKPDLAEPAGIEGPTTVLADRIDGRSRRTARGLERVRVMSPHKRPGLA